MRKRVIFFAFLPLLLILLLVLLFRWLSTDPTAPTFPPAQTQPRIGPIGLLTYNSLAENPFPCGKVWLFVHDLSLTNVHYYLFDIENRKILGELQNGSPILMDPDRTKVLCTRREFEGALTLRGRLRRFLDRISFNRFGLYSPGREVQVLWLVNLKANSNKLIGRLPLPPEATVFQPTPGLPGFPGIRGFIPFLRPSANFRYAVNKTSSGVLIPEIFVCDLKKGSFIQFDKGTFTQPEIYGSLVTWWDDESIVFYVANDGFRLFHVPTGKVTTLISTATLTQFLAGLDRATNAGHPTIFAVGSGNQRHLYLTESQPGLLGAKPYLARIEQPSATLQLIDKNFIPNPNSMSCIDRTETWQLLFGGARWDFPRYSIYLRELGTGQLRLLVDGLVKELPDPANFYNDTVIYIRTNALWQIDLNGSNNTRLFPPP